MSEPRPFTDEQKARFDELKNNGYLPAIEKRIMSQAVPFFWHGADGNVLHNGTLCLLDTGTRKLGITAEHVFRQYCEDLDARKVFHCQFGGVIVKPKELLIDSDRTLDIATFRMSDALLSGTARFSRAQAWPARPPQKHDWLFYGGYPKAHRVPRDRTIDTGFQVHFGQVHDVSDTQLMINLDFAHLYWPGHEGEPINEDLGGASGGPAFRLKEVRWPEVRMLQANLEFVGSICHDSSNYKVMFVRSAEVINPDGTLIRR